MSRTIRIGSRDSALAIRQAEILMSCVQANDPSIAFELVLIKTAGDKILDRNLDEIGGKGLFIKELEQALLDESIDIAVHSYKDMPYEETEGLPVVALSEREDPFDVLILPEGASDIDKTKPVGSSSLRRAIQFSKLHQDCEVKSIRGNVPTRLSKLDQGEYSALILARAGLNRLSLQDRVSRVFTLEEMIPSGSQGILAVQGRVSGDYAFLDCFHSKASETVSKGERRFLKTLSGGCSSPASVFEQMEAYEILLTGMYVDDAGNIAKGSIRGNAGNAEILGETLAKGLKDRTVIGNWIKSETGVSLRNVK